MGGKVLGKIMVDSCVECNILCLQLCFAFVLHFISENHLMGGCEGGNYVMVSTEKNYF